MAEMEYRIDPENTQQAHAFELIAKTNRSFFLTGRAGTGKTTFLKNVQKNIAKRFVVLAPTGVAAVAAGGQTIHSFFGLPLGVIGPGEVGNINGNKISILKHVDTIIVDEVSMVRCDLIDAMDRTLRQFRKSSAPFGGVQMVFVGDMFQLEPVVTADDKDILMQLYHETSFYFYKAAVIKRYGLPKIEFLKIYRQTDPAFVELLEHVRTGRMSAGDLYKINSRVVMPGESNAKLKVTLTSLKRDAERINAERLAALEAESFVYEAAYEGDASKCRGVAEDRLELKVGAQVMFTKNDSRGRWVNGTIGTVESLTADGIKVTLDDGVSAEVGLAQWESQEYEYDKETKSCKKKTVGVVTQYPLKLAWAITIHKSQSLTFDRVAVDFGRAAFGNGQAYVALSRARSLDGLELLRPMSAASVLVSRDVREFSADVNDEARIDWEIRVGKSIAPFLRDMDYDGAASCLYTMSSEEAAKGEYDVACELMALALTYTVDDSCLQGREWIPFRSDNVNHRILNAVGLYYSGEVEAAEAELRELGVALDSCFDGLYMLGRCVEDREDWEELANVYARMYELYNSSMEQGLDSPSFRKYRYRLAILNERQFGDPGAGLIRQLMAENPRYDRLHLALRWMLPSNEEARKDAAETEDNVLVDMMFNETVSDEEFIETLSRERDSKTDIWKDYRRYLNGLKLAMAC